VSFTLLLPLLLLLFVALVCYCGGEFLLCNGFE
jgi:hypothetical protein